MTVWKDETIFGCNRTLQMMLQTSQTTCGRILPTLWTGLVMKGQQIFFSLHHWQAW
jgi:hypothetical protein